MTEFNPFEKGNPPPKHPVDYHRRIKRLREVAESVRVAVAASDYHVIEEQVIEICDELKALEPFTLFEGNMHLANLRKPKPDPE